MTSILNEESGQAMVEYGLILILISLAIIASLSMLGSGPLKKLYEDGVSEIIKALNKNNI